MVYTFCAPSKLTPKTTVLLFFFLCTESGEKGRSTVRQLVDRPLVSIGSERGGRESERWWTSVCTLVLVGSSQIKSGLLGEDPVTDHLNVRFMLNPLTKEGRHRWRLTPINIGVSPFR